MADFDRIFVDTSFVQGFYNTNDQYHNICVHANSYFINAKERYITDLVLIEIGNAFSSIKKRKIGEEIIKNFLYSDDIIIIRFNETYFEKSLDLYSQIQDKDWGLTDCFSFVVMRDINLTTSLSTDKDFQQAGFKILPF